MATHSSILAWKILRKEQPGRLQTMGPQKSRTQLSDRANTDADSTPDPPSSGYNQEEHWQVDWKSV